MNRSYIRVQTSSCVILFVLFFLIFPGLSHASIFQVLGAAGRDMSMGNAMTAAAEDWSASFFNPSLLTRKQTMTLGVGFQLGIPMMTTQTSKNAAVATPNNILGLSMGMAIPIGGVLKKRVYFGYIFFIPGLDFYRINFRDPSTPHYYMYDSLIAKFEFLPSFAVRITDWLSVGVGMRMMATVPGGFSLNMDVANTRITKREMYFGAQASAAANAGIHTQPFKNLIIGASYQGEIALEINMPGDFKVDGLDFQANILLIGKAQWTPHTISFGATYLIERVQLRVASDLVYAMWSRAPDPALFFKIHMQGGDLEKLGLKNGISLPVNAENKPQSPGFSDTLSWRLGLEYTPKKWISLRTGYMYRPTPVPIQTTGTNILDNSLHMLTIGTGFVFKDPLEILEQPIAVDIGGQLGVLAPRFHKKEIQNEPVGDIHSQGFIYGLSFVVKYTFGS